MIQLTPDKCKTMREARRLSQAELSRRAGLSDNYVCRFECASIREPSHRKITALVDVLQSVPVVIVSVDELSGAKS